MAGIFDWVEGVASRLASDGGRWADSWRVRVDHCRLYDSFDLTVVLTEVLTLEAKLALAEAPALGEQPGSAPQG